MSLGMFRRLLLRQTVHLGHHVAGLGVRVYLPSSFSLYKHINHHYREAIKRRHNNRGRETTTKLLNNSCPVAACGRSRRLCTWRREGRWMKERKAEEKKQEKKRVSKVSGLFSWSVFFLPSSLFCSCCCRCCCFAAVNFEYAKGVRASP